MKSRAFRLAATYAAIAAAWLLFSDGALLLLRLSAEQIARFSVVKGFAFVLVTSVALYLLSDRFAMRAAAREREYRELFEQNPNPMWVYDVETLGFLAVNDAAVAKYGYSRDEFLAMTIADIRAPDHAGQPHGNVEVARTAAPEVTFVSNSL